MMELGAIVCIARIAALRRLPDRATLRLAAAGYPAYDGPRKAVQKKYEGSDRQVRGLIMRELRAAHIPVTRCRDSRRSGPTRCSASGRSRGCIVDGLVVDTDDGLALP